MPFPHRHAWEMGGRGPWPRQAIKVAQASWDARAFQGWLSCTSRGRALTARRTSVRLILRGKQVPSGNAIWPMQLAFIIAQRDEPNLSVGDALEMEAPCDRQFLPARRAPALQTAGWVLWTREQLPTCGMYETASMISDKRHHAALGRKIVTAHYSTPLSWFLFLSRDQEHHSAYLNLFLRVEPDSVDSLASRLKTIWIRSMKTCNLVR